MAKSSGVDFVLKIETSAGSGTYQTITNGIASSLSFNNGEVECTNKSSNNFKEVLSGAGIKSASLSFSAHYTEGTYQELLLTNARSNIVYNYQIVYGASSNTITGGFKVNSHDITDGGGVEGVQQLSFTLTSSGSITYA